jgi:hypothetical protein
MKTVVHGKIETTKWVFFSPKFGLQRIFHTPSCGRVSWLLGEGQQLALLLWLVRLIVNTQTRFSSEPALAFILFTEFHRKEKIKNEVIF